MPCPVMRATERIAQQTAAEQPAAVIARLDHGDLLVDAMVRPEGAAVVVRAALRRQAATGRHGAVRGAPRRSGLAKLVAGGRDVQPLGVEQSNSSVMVAHTLIAKLVRRLEAGANPDAELVAHLATRGFAHVPGLAATLEVDLVGESSPADVMVVHDAIPNEGDLWRWTLDELSVDLEQRGRFDADESTLWLAELLGRRTAELHIALADGDDADTTPEPFTLLWQRALLQTLRNSARATQRALRRARVDTEHAAFVLRPVDDVLARFETLRSRKLDARRIRVHGDLHLGQVLRSGTDVVFIDFEGEPGRPIGERRIKRSPLVDVAGLVRSLDYAGRSALDTAVARGLVPETEHEALDRGRAAWTTSAAGLLVDTYLGMIADADLVPAERHDAELLLDVYQLQKGLYEIRYELANRPDWVHWPLSAVAEMIRGS
jgi:maltose alpha-D-glucosyltransferase / alpha-amylase